MIKGKGAGVKDEFWDWGQFILPWSPRSMGPLMNFPSPPVFSREVMTFIECLVQVSINPLHNTWLHRHFVKASGGSPSLCLLAPCLLPWPLLTPPPPLCFSENCGCLNGGTCVSYKYFSNIQRCNCPKKFQGEHCEIGTGILSLTRRRAHQKFGGRERKVGCKGR